MKKARWALSFENEYLKVQTSRTVLVKVLVLKPRSKEACTSGCLERSAKPSASSTKSRSSAILCSNMPWQHRATIGFLYAHKLFNIHCDPRGI